MGALIEGYGLPILRWNQVISSIQQNFFGPIAYPVWYLLKEVLLYLNHVYHEILKSVPYLTAKEVLYRIPRKFAGAPDR